MALPQWRKNQIAVTISSAFLNFGYTLVMSFLPIYVRELGVQSTGGIACWSGLILSASPLMASLVGPLWGRLGDQKGLRMIAARATAANAVFWALMALAQNVWQLFLLRIVLGLLGGFTTVAVALVTQLAPKEKVPSIIGTLQSVQILSTALGPFFGGILATSIGVRNTFIVTGIMNFVSLLSILLLYADEDMTTSPEAMSSMQDAKSASGFWKQPEYFTALMILF